MTTRDERMRKFDRTERFGRRDRNSRSEGRFERKGRNDRKDSGLEFHKVVCAKCGARCEVPFRPSGDKPVYCRDCFKKNEQPESRGRDNYRKQDRPERSEASELREINRKLDLIMEAMELR